MSSNLDISVSKIKEEITIEDVKYNIPNEELPQIPKEEQDDYKEIEIKIETENPYTDDTSEQYNNRDPLKIETDSKLNTENRKSASNRYNKCNGLCFDAYDVSLHMGVRKVGENLVCVYGGCNQLFKGESELLDHIIGIHSDAQKYDTNLLSDVKVHFDEFFKFKQSFGEGNGFPCSLEGCNKLFYSKYLLSQHLKFHEDGIRFFCPYFGCKKGYKRHVTLLRHVKLHTGDESDQFCAKKRKSELFICNVKNCNKKYQRKSYLSYHKLAVHKNTLFACHYENCSKSFRSRRYLRTHLKCHEAVKSFFCDFPRCRKSFLEKCLLTIHKRTHVEEGQHPCTFCDTSFISKQGLVRHIKNHRVNNSYRCTYKNCDQVYRWPGSLQRHFVTHLKE